MFLAIVLWALGAFFLILMAGLIMSVPGWIGRAVEHGIRRKPPEPPLKKFVDEYNAHRAPRGS